MNKYDLNHVTTGHPRMSPEEWTRAYKMAWETYYTLDHIETVLRRAVASRISAGNAVFLITWFKGCIDFENIHPLEGGFLRLKFRRDRRPSLPIEPVWVFYPKYIVETVRKQFQWASLYWRLRRIYLRIKKDERRYEYMDLALSPVTDDEESRELFNSAEAQAFVGQEKRLNDIIHGPTHPHPAERAPQSAAVG